MRLNDFSLKIKIFGGFIVPITIMAAVTFGSILLSRDVASNARLAKDESAVYAAVARQMQLDVVQVQQWLSDISATRGQDGLNDGFDEAVKSRQSFLNGVAAFRKMYIAEKDQTSQTKLVQMEQAFNVYFQTGKKMAQAYIDGGPAEGNKKMADFDEAAETLGERLEPFIDQQVKEFDTAMQSIIEAADTMQKSILLAGLGLTITTLILAFLLARMITKPINQVVGSLKDLATGEGDLTIRLQAGSRDEVGELANWFNVFIEKLQVIIREIAGSVQTLSSSSTELSAISGQMTQGIQVVSGNSDSVSAAAEEMSANMNNVAAAAEQCATNTNLVATSSEEMSSTIGEIARNAEKAKEISDEATVKSTSASANMDLLGNAADSIGKVVETITEISEQVNLLALNATIEAARAGDAGKGFAVVANEIKELAKQTAEASQDIKEKIGAIQGTTSGTVEQITEITRVITDVNEVVTNIASAVEQQSAATQEIATNVTQASQGIQEVTENVNQSSTVSHEISKDIAGVSDSMNEMSATSSQVDLSAKELSQLSENLKRMVDQFKI